MSREYPVYSGWARSTGGLDFGLVSELVYMTDWVLTCEVFITRVVSSRIELHCRTPSWCSMKIGELLGAENPHMWWVSEVFGVQKRANALALHSFHPFLQVPPLHPKKDQRQKVKWRNQDDSFKSVNLYSTSTIYANARVLFLSRQVYSFTEMQR